MLSLTELSWYDKDGKLRNILDFVHPVGSIYMTMDSQNPSTLFGGTWVRWGEGRVPVGVSANDSDFGTVEKTGGERKHQLITSEMPAHDHKGTYTKTQHSTIRIPRPNDPFTLVPSGTDAFEVTYEQTEHSESVQSSSRPIGDTLGIDYTKKVTALHGVPSQGESDAHNNLQPYITCYMWKRTA